MAWPLRKWRVSLCLAEDPAEDINPAIYSAGLSTLFALEKMIRFYQEAEPEWFTKTEALSAWLIWWLWKMDAWNTDEQSKKSFRATQAYPMTFFPFREPDDKIYIDRK